MPQNYKDSLLQIQNPPRIPVWTFSGLIVIVMLIITSFITSSINNDKYSDYIANPKSGDIYVIKLASNSYSLLKVDEVVDDSLYLVSHNYEVNKKSAIKKLYETDFDYEDVFTSHKQYVTDLFKENTII